MNVTLSFGQWLRQHRKARDLTQEELADAIGCSPEMVRKIEAGSEALMALPPGFRRARAPAASP